MSKPWIEAADAAGQLSEKTTSFLSCMLVPGGEGRGLIQLPPDTWQGMWRLMHMVKALPAHQAQDR